MKYIERYKKYENSNQDYHKILKDIVMDRCKPFIELSKSCRNPLSLWRGVSNKLIDNCDEISYLVYEAKSYLNDRKPMNTPNELHSKLNKEFYNKFGWNVRNGVFCTYDKGVAYNFSSITSNYRCSLAYFFIPIGDFKYCWSPKYYDLTAALADVYTKEEIKNLSDLKIRNIVNRYKDTNIEESQYKKSLSAKEISFKCDKYLLISERYFIDKSPSFWNW